MLAELNHDLFDLCCHNFAHEDAARTYRVVKFAPEYDIDLAFSASHAFCWIPRNREWRIEVVCRRLEISGNCPLLYFVPYREGDFALNKAECVDAHLELLATPLESYSNLLKAMIDKLPQDSWCTVRTDIRKTFLGINLKNVWVSYVPVVVAKDLCLGDASCVNNAISPYVQCAVNPEADCRECAHYQKR